MLPLNLILALATQLPLQTILICIPEEEESNSDALLDSYRDLNGIDIKFGLTRLDDLLDTLNHVEEMPENNGLLIVMAGKHGGNWTRRAFREQVTWLFPMEAELPFDPLKIRLDGNVLLYSDTDQDNGTITLKEVYSVKGLVTIQGNYGWFSKKTGEIVIPQWAKWHRRRDLRGIPFVNTVMGWAPFVIDATTENPSGLMIDVIDSFAKLVNLTMVPTNPPDLDYGSLK